MKQIIEEGIASGEIHPIDSVVAGAILFGGAMRLLHLAGDGVLDKPLGSYLDELFEAGWRGISV